MQRIMITLSEITRTEKELKEVGVLLANDLRECLMRHINLNYPFEGEIQDGVINREFIELIFKVFFYFVMGEGSGLITPWLNCFLLLFRRLHNSLQRVSPRFQRRPSFAACAL